MSQFRKLFTMLLCAFLIVPAISYGDVGLEDELVSELFTLNEEDKYIVFGEYVEIEVD